MTTPPTSETDLLLTAYVDGELDAASSLSFERRLDADPDLARARDEVLMLRLRLREAGSGEVAPDGLRRAMARIGGAEASTAVAATPRSARSGARLGFWRAASQRADWRMAVAACLVGMVAGAGLTRLVSAPSPDAPFMTEVVADHLRAVMAPQPFDVASSDQHTVKPWFTGRLPFAPEVFDLSGAGFPLVGGRVDVVGGQPAAALVFRHGKHIVSLISQPTEATHMAAHTVTADRGFELREWAFGGMHYWAVSDVAATELDAFVAAVKGRLAAGG